MQVTILAIVIDAFGTVTKGLLREWRTWKLANEWRPSKLQHYLEQLEYWEESWRLDETCCHTNSNEKPSALANVKNSKGVNIASIEDTADASKQRLEDYIEKHERGLITTIRNDLDNTINERMTTTRKQKWEGKLLYVRFWRLINNISHQKTWTWLRKGNLKIETVSLLIAA